MKKLFLALLFNLITLTAFGQDDFSGKVKHLNTLQ